MKLKTVAFVFSFLSFSSIASAQEQWTSMQDLCTARYGSGLLARCYNAIESHFSLSQNCGTVTVTGQETTPDLAAEGSCTTAQACTHVAEGLAPGEGGSGCGSG